MPGMVVQISWHFKGGHLREFFFSRFSLGKTTEQVHVDTTLFMHDRRCNATEQLTAQPNVRAKCILQEALFSLENVRICVE